MVTCSGDFNVSTFTLRGHDRSIKLCTGEECAVITRRQVHRYRRLPHVQEINRALQVANRNNVRRCFAYRKLFMARQLAIRATPIIGSRDRVLRSCLFFVWIRLSFGVNAPTQYDWWVLHSTTSPHPI